MEILGRAVLFGLFIGWLLKPDATESPGSGGESSPPPAGDVASGDETPAPGPDKPKTVRLVRVRRHSRRVRDPGATPPENSPETSKGETS